MDSLRRIERAEQRLWLLALLLLVLVTTGLLVLDASSVTVERLLSGMTARLADILSSYGASLALLTVVLLVCAYFYEKLAVVRTQNRELVLALDTSAQILAQRNQQLDTWSQLSHSLITNFNLPRLLDLIVRTAAEVTQSDCAAVMLKEERSAHLRVAAIHQRGLQMELARRVAAMTINTGEHIYLRPNALPEELDRPDLAWEDLVSLAAAPLVAADTVVGALLVGRLAPQEPFSSQIIEGLDSFASQASIALEKARLYAENQKQLDRLGKLLQDLRSTQSQLVNSERLAGLGTLAGGVAHVINGPLAAIVVRGDQLLAKNENAGAVQDGVSAMRQRALRAGEVLKGFLQLSRRPAAHPTNSLDLNEVVRRALGLMRNDLQDSGIEIAECYEDLPFLRGDSLQLEQVCANLLVNAARVVRSGGRLAIQTAALEPGWIRCTIEVGAPEPERAMAGDDSAGPAPIETEPSEIGPGLAAVAHIINAHGGRIETGGEPGDPTTFEVQLPVPVERQNSDAADREPAGATTGRGPGS
jgi:signal transduction histidine kinase